MSELENIAALERLATWVEVERSNSWKQGYEEGHDDGLREVDHDADHAKAEREALRTRLDKYIAIVKELSERHPSHITWADSCTFCTPSDSTHSTLCLWRRSVELIEDDIA